MKWNLDKIIFMYLYNLGIKNKGLIICISNVLPKIVVFMYFIALCYNFIYYKSQELIYFIFAPFFAFVSVGIIRSIVDRKRPFEIIDNIIPLIKHKNGKSFPSRHTVSAFIISILFWHVNFRIFIIMIILSTIIGISRIMSGVHYPSDIIFGIIYSFLVGYIFYILIF